MITKARATAALMLTAIFVITSCSGTDSSGSAAPGTRSATTTPSSPGTSPPTAPEPTRFTSATYGYRATLPGDWVAIPALEKWDGRSELSYDVAQVDQFGSGSPGAYGAAASWKRDLAAYTKFLITWTLLYHSETCPPKPTTRSPITIGGHPGVLLE